jgi:molybdenum cofactor biosynthesis enzyme MoaA
MTSPSNSPTAATSTVSSATTTARNRARRFPCDQYRALLEDLARMQTLFLMLTGGEPMIHPHFFEIGRMTKELGFVVRVRTNGHTLYPRNVERLLEEVDPYMAEVSLHGATPEVHDRQTRVPGSFERLVRNLRSARAAGLRCSMVTTPTAWNEHQIEDMFALSRRSRHPAALPGAGRAARQRRYRPAGDPASSRNLGPDRHAGERTPRP